MSVTRLAAMTGLLLAGLVTNAQAQQAAQGVIRFHGSIVEQGCKASATRGAMLTLSDCPQASRGSLIDVQRVQPVSSVDALSGAQANVRLADRGSHGRSDDQSYQLVDNGGMPIRTGLYVVTLTAP